MKRGHIDRYIYRYIDRYIDGHRDSMKESAKGRFFEKIFAGSQLRQTVGLINQLLSFLDKNGIMTG